MHSFKNRKRFFDSQEAADIRQKLRHMMVSDTYNTEPSFTIDSTQYPDNQMPFVDKHMNYLNSHPKLDAGMYLANLRLMTRVR